MRIADDSTGLLEVVKTSQNVSGSSYVVKRVETTAV